MNLHRKTFLLILAGVLAGLLVSLLVAHTAIQGTFREIEQVNAVDNLDRAVQAVEEDARVLDLAARDWAHWNDSYRFMLGEEPEYPDTNLLPGSFAANRLNLVMFVAPDGAHRHAVGFDLETEEFTGVPEPFASLGPGHALLRPPSEQASVSGIILAEGRPMIVSAWPILTSDGKGPPAGTLVWGRYLDGARAEEMAVRTKLDLRFVPAGQGSASATTVAALAAPPGSAHIVRAANDLIVASTRLDGIDGKAALAVEVHLPRPVYQQGVRTLAYVASTGIMVGGIILAGVTLALHRAVLGPVRLLSERANAIRASGSLKERVEVRGDDEIARLSRDFNDLIDRLEREHAELHRSNEDLKQFAEVVGHDLQGPLSTMALNAALLRERTPADDVEGQTRLARIESTSLRMADRVRAVLDYSRVAAHEGRNGPVDLGEVMRDVVSDLEWRIQASQGTVEWGALPTLEADQHQMGQLLQNLVANGLKYCRPGVPPRVRVSATPHEGGWRITVQDNGRGFDVGEFERMVRPYLRLDSGKGTSGHGLGLATCVRILERHGGRLSADSSPGVGSAFHVDLPAAQPQAGAVTPSGRPAAAAPRSGPGAPPAGSAPGAAASG